MKLRKVQTLKNFIECKITVGCPSCTYIQAFTLSSQDDGRLPVVHVSKHSCVCDVCVVCACSAWWCLVCCVFCVLCVSVGVCVGVCGVVSGVCGVCVSTRLGTRKTPVCRFQTLPCVPAKRAHVEHMRAFCRYTRKRFGH